MENNCNHNCERCETCISFNKNDSRVCIPTIGEPMGIEYWCKDHERYVKPNFNCGDHMDSLVIVASAGETVSNQEEKGIARTRTNQHNVNNQ